jgi:hypothetical protein
MAGAFVKRTNNSANGNTITFTPTNNGDWLVVDVYSSAGGGTPTASISDNNSSSWQTLLATNQFVSGQWKTVFYLENCSTAITLITLTFNGGTPGTCLLSVAEFSGLATSSSILAHTGFNSQVTPGTANDAITSGNLNFSSTPGLLIGGCLDYGGGNSMSSGTGFTSDGTMGNSAGLWEHERLTSNNSAVAATFSSATHGAADSYVTWAVAVLEPTSGGSASVTPTAGALALGGNAATVTPAQNLVIAPVTARRFERAPSGLLVPSRKIFLPSYRVLKRVA